jgi:hypothetical protein
LLDITLKDTLKCRLLRQEGVYPAVYRVIACTKFLFFNNQFPSFYSGYCYQVGPVYGLKVVLSPPQTPVCVPLGRYSFKVNKIYKGAKGYVFLILPDDRTYSANKIRGEAGKRVGGRAGETSASAGEGVERRYCGFAGG